MKFKNLWDIESAMQVMASKTVDADLWAEAVEWLIVYGPPEVQQMLIEASSSATKSTFPYLKPSLVGSDGEAYYSIADLAATLGISEDEAREIIKKKQKEHNLFDFISPETDGTTH